MKKGSALLIVLGMVSFMVISAVAFLAYMRNSRLPSSYLRRSSSSRHLAKAALAEAIDIIDASIGQDPFPGMGDNGNAYPYPRKSTTEQTSFRHKRNYWVNHCFIGTNRLIDASETVSTLTLEGLAYIPPALINEARYFSRHSPAGMWHTLGFDSGRFAFSAIDVSDHIDINRVFADIGRNSSDRGRVTIAHVFENPAHTSYGTPSPSQWDEFLNSEFLNVDDIKDGVQNAYDTPSKLPFTSLADLNLAINKKGWATTMSPFCRNVLNGEDFVISTGATDQKASMMRNMAFVTDSYFPNTNDNESVKYDLTYSQPFARMYHTKNQQMSYMDQLDGGMSTPILTKLYDTMTEIDSVSLYDYLDENDIPTSLAIPCVERVPMICMLQPNVQFQIETQPPTKNPEPPTSGLTQASPPITVNHVYKLKIQNPIAKVAAGCLYPFRRDREADNGKSFTVDYAIRIGFAIGTGPGLRTTANSAFVIRDNADFEKNGVEGGVIKLYQKAATNPKCSNVKTEDEAFTKIADVDFSQFSQVENWFQNAELFSIPYTYRVQNMGTQDNPNYQYVADDAPSGAATINPNFHPLNANGTGNGGFDGVASVQVLPYMTVTARIKSGESSKFVDLVPASWADDETYNQLNTPQELAPVCGNDRPLLTMAGATPINFSGESWEGQSVMVSLSPSESGGSFVCPDPRWNFSPEDFYVMNGAMPAASTFIQNCDLGNGGRDNDIFLMVSNQGYMQSPSEFSFLPRTTTATLPHSEQPGARGNFTRTTLATSEGAAPYQDLAHGDFMWKTYRLYDSNQDGIASDGIYNLGVRADGTGFRVNPFTSSKEVMMAALANTPVSWWAASTNFNTAVGKSALDGLGAEDFNKKYAFCQMNSEAKFYWKDLELVAERLMGSMRTADGNWEAGFHNAWFDDGTHDLCGVDFSNGTNADDLYDVDRKMLYGFWRDSFANKQQLFLVFIRAEPLMMGGGRIGQSPPQLGARAVALVWRDPRDPRRLPNTRLGSGDDNAPHRTRVLFYRQFD